MSENDLRPSVWVGHIVLESDRHANDISGAACGGI